MGVLLFFVRLVVLTSLVDGLRYVFPSLSQVSVIFNIVDLALIALQAMTWSLILKRLNTKYTGLTAVGTLITVADIVYVATYMLPTGLSRIPSSIALLLLSSIVGALALPAITYGLRKVTSSWVFQALWVALIVLAFLPMAGDAFIQIPFAIWSLTH